MDEDIEAENAAIRAMLGTSSFGKVSRESNIQAQIDSARRITPADSSKAKLKDKSDDDEDDDEEDDEDDDDEFPVSHELVLKTHERAVTTATVDPAGVRLITGSTDCTFKLHDFTSMTPTTLRAFKTIEPSATKFSEAADLHAVQLVAFNPVSPSTVLVLSPLPQAKIYSRDGDLLFETVKGDMYLRDLNITKGHTAEITSGAWSPTNRNLCVTASTDSTLRIWDVNEKRAQKDVIAFRSKVAGNAGRSRMTAVAWGSPAQRGPNVLVSTALDGTLVMYSGDGPYNRPAAEIRDAHAKNTWTSSVDISSDGRMVVTRGGDDTVKIWDVRKFKSPVSSQNYPSMPGQYRNASIKYSPSSTNIIMGTQEGNLLILNPATLKTELSTPVTPGSPLIVALWHEKLNQIITGSANGETHVLYNPNTSTGGAKDIMTRTPKRRHIDDNPNLTMDLAQGIDPNSIIAPGGILEGSNSASWGARHPTVGLTASGKPKDPRRPHIPHQTPFANKGPDEVHIRQSVPLSAMRSENPRDALLKYAEEAKKNPIFTKAYQKTQPNPIFAVADEDEEPEPEKKKQKR
jgi:WD repeat-containing protein 70